MKHMLKKCAKDKIIRIGSRSLEPRLEECNLSYVCRQENHRLDKHAYEQLRNTKGEIQLAMKKLLEKCDELVSENGVSVMDCLVFLEEAQITNLLYGQDLRKFTINDDSQGQNGQKKKKKAKIFAGKNVIDGFVSKLKLAHESFRNFLEYAKIKSNHLQPWEKQFLGLLKYALDQWLPSIRQIHTMRDLVSPALRPVEDPIAEPDNAGDVCLICGFPACNGDVEDEYDADMIAEEQERRMMYVATTGYTKGNNKAGKSSEKHERKLIITKFNDSGNKRFRLCDFPNEHMAYDPQICQRNDLCSMRPEERIRFLFSKLVGQVHEEKKEDVNDIFEEMIQLQREKEDLEVARQYSAASAAKVVGATITGASIHSKLIARLRPKVVIVEEAAEIAEPGLVAAISQSTEHLILIGDHQQVLTHFV